MNTETSTNNSVQMSKVLMLNQWKLWTWVEQQEDYPGQDAPKWLVIAWLECRSGMKIPEAGLSDDLAKQFLRALNENGQI